MRKRRRFTPEFKAKVVLDVLTGAQAPAEACRKHALSPNGSIPEKWRSLFGLDSIASDLSVSQYP